MIDIAEELRQIYKTNNIPLGKKVFDKKYRLYFPELKLTVENDRVVSQSASMQESICSESELSFGGCESSCFKIKVADVPDSIIGKRMEVTQIVKGMYECPFGTYIVSSAERTDDLRLKKIIAYDISQQAMQKDVVSWYNSLNFPVTLKVFRQSLFVYVGIPLEDKELVNDDMLVEKTIDAASLPARDVARAIGEISGSFGMMRRTGKFSFIYLAYPGLYPSKELFPSEELFPCGGTDRLSSSVKKTAKFEEYEVKSIDCLQIRQEEGDVGAVIFDTRNYVNPYIITGNFLVYGKNAKELEVIGRNLFDQIKGYAYVPCRASVLGLPYLEPGDSLTIENRKTFIDTYIFTRTLSGGQALQDEIISQGKEYRDNSVSPNDEIEMLKGKSLIIQKSVDGLSSKVTDLEADTSSRFAQTANQITLEVASLDKKLSGQISLTKERLETEIKNTESGLSSKIEQTASSITQRVNGLEGAYASIELDLEDILFSLFDMEGNVTSLKMDMEGFTFQSVGGTVKIKGDSIETGTLKSVSVVFDTHNAVYWVAGGSSLLDTGGADWVCDSNAIWTGNRNIQLYTNGDIHGTGTAYLGEVIIDNSWYQGWTVTECLEDIYRRLNAGGI